METEYKTSGHAYLFVAHNDTDHSHVHAVIKMTSSRGNKLDPRKAYLNRVRQDYAKICRSYGIEVEASSRAERGLSGPSTKSEFVHMRRRGKQPQADIDLLKKLEAERKLGRIQKHPSEEKALRRNQIIRKRYVDKARELVQNSKIIDNKTEKEKYYNAARALHKHARAVVREEKIQERLMVEVDRN